MLARFDRSPRFALIFVLALFLPQLAALGEQFVRGFRPFRHDPIRVSYSWDMFTNHVERCVEDWSPAVESPAGKVSSLKQLGTKLEWDVVYDRVVDYEAVARWICVLGNFQPHVRLRCFLPNGSEMKHEFDCR
jgi:hypothetical protein